MSEKSGQLSDTPSNLFIQMSGAPGSGKSTTAKLLASLINGIVVDHEIIKSVLQEHKFPMTEAATVAYDLGWALAEDVIKQGQSVIIDSPCICQDGLNLGAALAQKYGFKLWYMKCNVEDTKPLDNRIRDRIRLRSQRTDVDCPPIYTAGTIYSEDSRTLFKTWIESPCRPNVSGIIVDSTGGPENHRDFIIERLCPPLPGKYSQNPNLCFHEGKGQQPKDMDLSMKLIRKWLQDIYHETKIKVLCANDELYPAQMQDK